MNGTVGNGTVPAMAREGDKERPLKERPHLPPLQPLDVFRGQRVLVFSPHPNDDVLGCGGTLRALFEQGSNILAVYMTDGRYGSPSIPQEEVASVRRLETVNAATVLGIGNLQFLDRPDQGLRCDKATIKEAREAIEAYAPSLVLAPDPTDVDPDHRATSRIAQAATAGEEVTLWQYEIRTALRPDLVVDVTCAMAYKERAIREHRSQLETENYLDKVKGLNSFRSLGLGPAIRFCEAFSLVQE